MIANKYIVVILLAMAASFNAGATTPCEEGIKEAIAASTNNQFVAEEPIGLDLNTVSSQEVDVLAHSVGQYLWFRVQIGEMMGQSCQVLSVTQE